MGSCYNNVTFLETRVENLRSIYSRPAYVIVSGPDVVLFAEEHETLRLDGAATSAALGCVCFCVGVHDDNILSWSVHHRGRLVTIGSVPDVMEYFGIDPSEVNDTYPEIAGAFPTALSPAEHARALVAALHRGDERATRTALEAQFFCFASERHLALVEALRLPTAAVGWGYTYLSEEPSAGSRPAVESLHP